MDDITSLEGPVERVEGKLTLRIPLAAGGQALAPCARGVSEIDGEDLKVTIPEWLAEKLGIHEGSLVIVDNRNGKFNIRLSAPSNE